MSVNLKQLIEKFFILQGHTQALIKICHSTGFADTTIRRWLRKGFPEAHAAYLVARAVGATEEEAIRLTAEIFPSPVRAPLPAL